eukprot:CAMPEP_0198198050 /NCGR_PEP_ID=MMETSP1445-20131203/1564_1 /TAXON_ID=36898 /ORGANISM="Pyramimonas sp., Strain CCMP2087" /LENGTH=71 /DNA_ID=CAMNT_0043867493 /DNA_START=339 /DNA_END=554 /DNA_ORIENTATION=-
MSVFLQVTELGLLWSPAPAAPLGGGAHTFWFAFTSDAAATAHSSADRRSDSDARDGYGHDHAPELSKRKRG